MTAAVVSGRQVLCRWFTRIIGGARRPKQVRLYLYVRAGAPHSGWRSCDGSALCARNREHWRGNGQLL